MNFYNAYTEVMKEYDKLKMEARLVKEERLEKIYVIIPRFKEIDEEMTKISTKSAMNMLMINSSLSVLEKEQIKDKLKQELANKIDLLKNEQDELLASCDMSRRFFDEIYICEKCHDEGYIEGKKCSCLQQKLIDKYYAIANISHSAEADFSKFDLSYYDKNKDEEYGMSPYENMNLVLKGINKFIGDFDKKKSNLLFIGQPGLGKTFLSSCVGKSILQKGNSVLYLTAPDLISLLEQKQFSKDVEDTAVISEYVDMIFTTSLLIIDDLGTEKSNAFTQPEIFRIINSRMISNLNGGLSTIISTNCDMDKLQEIYTERIISRFIGEYTTYRFFGNDIRFKKKFRS